jgi:8-oxo-dGTP pyrophosphatase MutT (NUDIX family)
VEKFWFAFIKRKVITFSWRAFKIWRKYSQALKREIKEELGIKIKKFSLIGLVDNFYEEEGKKHHEINLVFHVIPEKIVSESREDHISSPLFDKKRFKKEKVLSIALQKAILKWQKDKKFFWASQMRENNFHK